MKDFLSIFIPGIVFILVIGNIFAAAIYARDLRKEMMAEGRKKTPIGHSTKRKKASLKCSNKRYVISKRNYTYLIKSKKR